MTNSDLSPPGWWEDEDDFPEEDPMEDEFSLDECGFIPSKGCLLAVTEDCDFDCPWRDMFYKTLSEERGSSSTSLSIDSEAR